MVYKLLRVLALAVTEALKIRNFRRLFYFAWYKFLFFRAVCHPEPQVRDLALHRRCA
jgi:hypothetical protein